MKKVLGIAACLLAMMVSHAQVVINEYSASNLHQFKDSFGRTEDWIELYNSGNTPLDISGWHLSDKTHKPEKWDIPEGTIIQPQQFITFLCSGRDGKFNGEYHTNFKFAQTKMNEVVLLSNTDGNVIEEFPLAITLVEHSRCRSQDGGGEWKICTNPSFGSSNNSTNQFDRYTVAPEILLDAGYYSGEQTVEIKSNDSEGVVRYTTDGLNPTENSPIYTDPIVISETTVIKAKSFSSNTSILDGKMDFHTFFIDEDYSLAVFSVAADSVIELANGNGEIIPIGSIEYFDLNKELKATSFGSLNRHGQDSWVLPHRSLDWVSRDEMGYSKAVSAPIFSYSQRDEYQKFMFRNSGDDNYPAIDDEDHEGSTHIRDEYVQTLSHDAGMELDLRAVERVVLFLNGKYWGVYGMRERPVDHDYTKEYYDQGKYEIQYLSTWNETTIEYGGDKAQTEWIGLRDFVLNNDMSTTDNYKIVTDSLNVLSLIDYMLVNLTVVASDWLNYNTGWWRGLNEDGGHKKWGYILWDLDATFDYYINYSGVPNTNPDADPCDLNQIAEFMNEFFFFAEDVGQHEKIFLKLLNENADFKQLYYSRYADMMNTTYSCENMISTLDSMLATIEPEMPRQIDRWGGTMDEWKGNVQKLKNFINQRCELLDDGMLECYEELSGPYNVVIETEPKNIGSVKLNTIDLNQLPFSGEYFGGMKNWVDASVIESKIDEYQFSHWKNKTGMTNLNDSLKHRTTFEINGTDTLIAVFKLRDGSIDPKDIVINELIASSDSLSMISDPAGEYDDWIELYNNTPNDVDLSGAYLSDDENNLKKWEFPAGTTIESHGYLIVWADDDEGQNGLHANFKLSKKGESIFLSDVDTMVIDQVEFEEQQKNVAYARNPNGTGNFVFQKPTFNENNEVNTSTVNPELLESVKIYPNPTYGIFNLDFKVGKKSDLSVSIMDVTGKEVLSLIDGSNAYGVGQHQLSFNLSEYSLLPGTYWVSIKSAEVNSVKKLILINK